MESYYQNPLEPTPTSAQPASKTNMLLPILTAIGLAIIASIIINQIVKTHLEKLSRDKQ